MRIRYNIRFPGIAFIESVENLKSTKGFKHDGQFNPRPRVSGSEAL